MRLPFPERIPLVPVFWFATVLCAIQQYQRTNAMFSLGCFFFILAAALAFNVAGGFTRASGSYIFFYATLTVIIGLCWKAILGEPADSNLSAPLLTIGVFLAGICMMLVAVLLSNKIKTKRAILGTMVTDVNMQTATVGCLITGFAIYAIGTMVTWTSGSVISALGQLNRFLPLTIILGVIHTIRRSKGTRSINLPVLLAGGFIFTLGIIGFSKEGILTPFICWIIAAASQRYTISRRLIVYWILGAVFVFQYLVPYAQYGRVYRQDSLYDTIGVSLNLLSNLGYVREQYLEQSVSSYEDEGAFGYYNSPQGFFDRLEELSIDDALIAHTDQFGPIGYWPIIVDIQNSVPHFIWKDKPQIGLGNFYAHEIGMLAEEDESTGISFSPTAEAFHISRWYGVCLLAPFLWFLLFALFDSLCGDTRITPWGLLVMVTFAHLAPEGGLGGIFYAFVYLNFSIIFAAVFGAYVMPVLGTFFIGPEGIQIRRGAPIRSIPRRLPPPVATES